MSQSLSFLVPRRAASYNHQLEFIKKVQKAFNEGNHVVLDFNNLNNVQSLILGVLFFLIKKSASRVSLKGVSGNLNDQLRMVAGKFVNKLNTATEESASA